MIDFVQLINFEKWYGKLQAVKPLNLSMSKGETFALLGPNGSGKSTIIRSLAGLHFPNRGRILIDGKDYQKLTLAARQKISFMPQRITMPEYLTAREIITLFAKLRKVDLAKVDEMIDFVKLENSADRYTGEYSGGMLQRVGLAVAFLADVDIYVLDEPTLNLDVLGIQSFRELVQKLKNNGKTIIFSSHILEDAVQLADRVGILVEGRLAKIESVPTFKNDIARETRVRIKLATALDNLQEIFGHINAHYTSENGRTITFKAEPKDRLSVIRAIEKAGGIVEEFHTDLPNWDVLLHHHFQGNVY